MTFVIYQPRARRFELARGVERPNHRARLVDRFVEFGGGIGIRDHAAARLNVYAIVLDQQRAQRDRSIGVAGVAEIADRAGIDAAPHRFELVDNFHRADFRRARDRALRKGRGKCIEGVASVAQLAGDIRHDVHHVLVALDHHQLGDVDRADFSDAADIVAPEVDQHDVLGALLRIGEEFLLEFAILVLGLAARGAFPRSGAG